jgi:hypothetical protein
MLANARTAVENAKAKMSEEVYKKAMSEVYIAEGSDWFWWYGDEHVAENKGDFDVLFRWHIAEIYKTIGLNVPDDVSNAIGSTEKKVTLVQQNGHVNPTIDGRITTETEWENAGFYDASSAMSDMHQVGELLERFWFASDSDKIFIRCDTKEILKDDELIELHFQSPKEFKVMIRANSCELLCDSELSIKDFAMGVGNLYEFYFSRSSIFGNKEKEDSDIVELTIRTKVSGSEIYYPRQGMIKARL